MNSIAREFEDFCINKIIGTRKISSGMKSKIKELIRCNRIEIKIEGKWLWVTGNIRPYSKYFQDKKLIYSTKRNAWYYSE